MRRLIGIGTAILVILMLVWVVVAWKMREAVPQPANDPRLTFATRFHNVKPEVQYVGDDECARCHGELVRKFRNNPMGRSITPITVQDHLEYFDANAHNPFEANGFRFRAERAENQLFHHETRLAKQDVDSISFTAEVHYAIGSGTRARSYLINRENRLFQSALTWYSQRGVWDLSPGF